MTSAGRKHSASCGRCGWWRRLWRTPSAGLPTGRSSTRPVRNETRIHAEQRQERHLWRPTRVPPRSWTQLPELQEVAAVRRAALAERVRSPSRCVAKMSSVRTPAALVLADRRTWRTHVQRTSCRKLSKRFAHHFECAVHVLTYIT